MNISLEEAKKSVGYGWSKLLEEIYEILPEGAYILQIKEKFGGLRFYVENVPESVQEFIWEKENESGSICEVCGKEGQPRDGGWIKTLCDEHASEKRKGIR